MSRFVLLIGIVFLSCRGRVETGPVERNGFCMDTVVRVRVLDRDKPEIRIESAIDKAFGVMKTLEGVLSVHVDSSDIARISRASGIHGVRVRPETAELLRQAAVVSENSKGSFDVSIWPLKELWPFDSESPQLPSPQSIRLACSKIDYRGIVVKKDSVFLSKPGSGIDLGGIAKGFIVDRAVETLKREGLKSGIVEAGGDLRIFGVHPDHKTWQIGVRHPRSEQGALIAILQVQETCIATSGDYERFFILNGKRYHHILDPHTGYPADSCVSVTVVAPSAVLADAYATAVFVLGPEKAFKMIEKLPGLECLIFSEKNGRLNHVVSSGLKSKVQFIN